jgi:hypothetical protein
MNHQQYKQKKRELAEQLKDLNELSRLERLNIGKEAARILEKERRHLKKELRRRVNENDGK